MIALISFKSNTCIDTGGRKSECLTRIFFNISNDLSLVKRLSKESLYTWYAISTRQDVFLKSKCCEIAKRQICDMKSKKSVWISLSSYYSFSMYSSKMYESYLRKYSMSFAFSQILLNLSSFRYRLPRKCFETRHSSGISKRAPSCFLMNIISDKIPMCFWVFC